MTRQTLIRPAVSEELIIITLMGYTKSLTETEAETMETTMVLKTVEIQVGLGTLGTVAATMVNVTNSYW